MLVFTDSVEPFGKACAARSRSALRTARSRRDFGSGRYCFTRNFWIRDLHTDRGVLSIDPVPTNHADAVHDASKIPKKVILHFSCRIHNQNAATLRPRSTGSVLASLLIAMDSAMLRAVAVSGMTKKETWIHCTKPLTKNIPSVCERMPPNGRQQTDD